MKFLRLVLTPVLIGLMAGAAVWWQRTENPPLEVMVGQMILLGFPGTEAKSEWPQRVARQIHDGQIGGALFLGNNFKTRADVLDMTALFHRAGGPFPAFIVVDMEGGLVQRLGPKLGYEAIPSAEKVGATMTLEQAKVNFEEIARLVQEAGFNVNLGPVVDLGGEPLNPIFLQHRTFDSDPVKVANYARAFLLAHRKRGIITVLKHFPGHGSSRTDSHDDFVDVSDSWKPRELEPYRQLIGEGVVTGIMTGHLLQRELASDGFPVSLSKTAISGVLRHDLGYDGLVVSDDLQMKAISKHYGLEEAVVRAINAGTDVLMVTNTPDRDPDLPNKIIALVRRAVTDGRIEKSTIRAAWKRIRRAKASLK